MQSSNQQLLGQIDSGELSHKDIQIELSEDADEQHIEMNLDMGVFDVAPIPQEQEIQVRIPSAGSVPRKAGANGEQRGPVGPLIQDLS
ncbi:hypothetical protein HK105_204255 [Polyrhizophydium stewartii]|uniref:Uncharacterized protein n=1 Tax=Polyrhizophydium stewartii TaxID=2732419 RepID=A0ABR4N9G6_9FUNG